MYLFVSKMFVSINMESHKVLESSSSISHSFIFLCFISFSLSLGSENFTPLLAPLTCFHILKLSASLNVSRQYSLASSPSSRRMFTIAWQLILKQATVSYTPSCKVSEPMDTSLGTRSRIMPLILILSIAIQTP